MTNNINVFVAFSSRCPNDTRDDVKQTVTESFNKIQTNTNIHDSKDVYMEQFADQGGWDGYVNYVSQGCNFYSRQPNFDIIVCPNKRVGKATAELVRKFIEKSKPVLLLEDTTFFHVRNVISEDVDNWQDGWVLDIVN